MYTSTHLVEASLVGASLLPMVGKTKLTGSLGHHPNHQIVWTVLSYCRSGGIVGMCYFSQMGWPVGFFVFFQLSDHAHNHLVRSLYQSICLGVVGHGPQSFHANNHAQFLNYTTGKASPLSLKSLAGDPKIEMWPPYRNLVMVFAVWSGVTYANMCLVKWSGKPKTLVTLGDWFSYNVLNTCEVNM